MPHKKRKVRKLRGSRTQGYGQVGQHRRGKGRGKAGLRTSKHKWSYTIKNALNLFPMKRGFKPPMRYKLTVDSINVGKLDEQVGKMLKSNLATKTKEAISIDLERLGYDKLLGSGKITHPLIVRVKFTSKTAERKITEAGGQIKKID